MMQPGNSHRRRVPFVLRSTTIAGASLTASGGHERSGHRAGVDAGPAGSRGPRGGPGRRDRAARPGVRHGAGQRVRPRVAAAAGGRRLGVRSTPNDTAAGLASHAVLLASSAVVVRPVLARHVPTRQLDDQDAGPRPRPTAGPLMKSGKPPARSLVTSAALHGLQPRPIEIGVAITPAYTPAFEIHGLRVDDDRDSSRLAAVRINLANLVTQALRAQRQQIPQGLVTITVRPTTDVRHLAGIALPTAIAILAANNACDPGTSSRTSRERGTTPSVTGPATSEPS